MWLVGCASLWLAWTGFVASDDSYYVNAARGWLHAFPYIPDNFGTARVVVALPMAAMFGLFGDSEFTAVISSCLLLLATASLTLGFLAPRIGIRNATVAAVVLVTVPLFALKSTIPSADLPELFFSVLSLCLFLLACERSSRLWILVFSGISAGLSFLAHETTAALLLFYGVLFLTGKGVRRREYWIMALSFTAVIGGECVYYWIVTGSPLYRLSMLGTVAESAGDRVQVGVFQVAAGGTLHVWAPIDPVLMFFTKQEFALLGLVTIPALAWAFRRPNGRDASARSLARTFALLGIVWFAFAEVVLAKLVLLPRYYMMPAYCFFVVVSIWVATAVAPRRPRVAVTAILTFVSVNLLCIAVDNKNPRFGERALVDYLKHSAGIVYTDPYTAYYSDNYAQWAGVDFSRVRGEPPTPGYAYFYNPANADQPNRFVAAGEVKWYGAPTSWKVVWSEKAPPRFIGVLMEKLGLLPYLPSALARKLLSPNPAVAVYVRTADPGPQ